MLNEEIEFKSLAIYRYFKEINGVLSVKNKPPTLLQKLSDKEFETENYVLFANSLDDIYQFKYCTMRVAIVLIQDCLNESIHDNLTEHQKNKCASFFDSYFKESIIFEKYVNELKIEPILKEKQHLESNINTIQTSKKIKM
jgi:hypothetical protein